MPNEMQNMSIENTRPVTLLLGALGGQGGGVLGDWLVEAAHSAGFPAQATSTPGVAQRTGATTYYLEMFPVKNPPAQPIFSLFPAVGDLDIMAAMEPTEAGRAMERGWVSDRTTIFTATERIYSTAEKVPAGDGRIPTAPIFDSLRKASKDVVLLDMDSLAAGSSTRGNAILFGAIIGSGIFPLDQEDCRNAIRAKGVAVDSNLAGFDIGLKAAAGSSELPEDEELGIFNAAPSGFESTVGAYPETLQPVIGHCLARLVDYQNVAYARLYLDRLKSIYDVDGGPEKNLTEKVARSLARWMTFEDVIRVAQLKTRAGRLSRIRGELGVDDSTPLKVTDYFKPGREEITGILPAGLTWLVPNTKKLSPSNGMALHIQTGSFTGFVLLKFLVALKSWRLRSAQYLKENTAIEQWLNAISAAAAVDNDLACRTADLTIWARGYGNVRRTSLNKLNDLFVNWTDRLQDKEKLSAEIDQLLMLAKASQD